MQGYRYLKLSYSHVCIYIHTHTYTDWYRPRFMWRLLHCCVSITSFAQNIFDKGNKGIFFPSDLTSYKPGRKLGSSRRIQISPVVIWKFPQIPPGTLKPRLSRLSQFPGPGRKRKKAKKVAWQTAVRFRNASSHPSRGFTWQSKKTMTSPRAASPPDFLAAIKPMVFSCLTPWGPRMASHTHTYKK